MLQSVIDQPGGVGLIGIGDAKHFDIRRCADPHEPHLFDPRPRWNSELMLHLSALHWVRSGGQHIVKRSRTERTGQEVGRRVYIGDCNPDMVNPAHTGRGVVRLADRCKFGDIRRPALGQFSQRIIERLGVRLIEMRVEGFSVAISFDHRPAALGCGPLIHLEPFVAGLLANRVSEVCNVALKRVFLTGKRGALRHYYMWHWLISLFIHHDNGISHRAVPPLWPWAATKPISSI